MTRTTRLLRGMTDLGMGFGTGLVIATALDAIRPSLTGPWANIVPNFHLGPSALLVGAAVFVASAAVRRRLMLRSVNAPQPAGALKSAKERRSLVE